MGQDICGVRHLQKLADRVYIEPEKQLKQICMRHPGSL